jgi:hypothetical protein
VRVVSRALLQHHGNSSAQLLIEVLDDQRISSQDRVDGAADIQERHVLPNRLRQFAQTIPADTRVMSINAGHLVWIRGGPGVCSGTASAHANEDRLLR